LEQCHETAPDVLVELSGLRLAFDPMQMGGRAASHGAPAIHLAAVVAVK